MVSLHSSPGKLEGHLEVGPPRHPSASLNPSSDFAAALGNILTQADNGLSHACSISRIGFGAIGDVPLLDVFGGCADLAGGVVEQGLALSGVHLPKQVARLLIMVVVDPMVPVGRRAIERKRWLLEQRL